MMPGIEGTTIQINSLLLIAPFLAFLGIALLVFLVALMEFNRRTCSLERNRFIRQKSVRISFLIALGLIMAGIILFPFKLSSPRLIVEKIDFSNTGKLPVPFPSNSDDFQFAPNVLIIDDHNNTSPFNHEKMKDNILVLFWDGFLSTPFIGFPTGDYYVQFIARGSRAEDEYPKLKIECQVPDKNFYLVTSHIAYIELTPRYKPYRLNFKISGDISRIGRIRVTYFNDLYVAGKRKGRDVWIKEFRIVRQPGSVEGGTK